MVAARSKTEMKWQEWQTLADNAAYWDDRNEKVFCERYGKVLKASPIRNTRAERRAA
jgi:hypothetical protein